MRMIRAFKKIILVVFILTLSTIGIAETNVIITPKALQIGDTVGIIAPANYTPNDASYMIDYLESKGYKIVYGKSYYSKWYNFGGTDDVRADDINGFFKDKNIKAIKSNLPGRIFSLFSIAQAPKGKRQIGIIKIIAKIIRQPKVPVKSPP